MYQGRDKIKSAFGKTDLEKLGVLPVLVIIANENDHVLQLDRMKVQLITSDRQGVDPLPVEDVLRPERVTRPDFVPRTSPIPGLGRGKRQPAGGEVDERAFVAPVVAARGSAHGFFYFRLGKGPERLAGAKLYLAGIRHARTGRELLYFEIDWNR